MPETLNGAIQRIQALALSTTDVTVNKADSYPTEDAGMMPMVVTYLQGGRVVTEASGIVRLLYDVHADAYFNITSLADAYTLANLFVPEFSRRLAGDPTLNGTCNSIDFETLTVLRVPEEYNMTGALLYRFVIPLKFRLTTIT